MIKNYFFQVVERAKDFGAGMLNKKLKPGSFIGIYSANIVEVSIMISV